MLFERFELVLRGQAKNILSVSLNPINDRNATSKINCEIANEVNIIVLHNLYRINGNNQGMFCY